MPPVQWQSIHGLLSLRMFMPHVPPEMIEPRESFAALLRILTISNSTVVFLGMWDLFTMP